MSVINWPSVDAVRKQVLLFMAIYHPLVLPNNLIRFVSGNFTIHETSIYNELIVRNFYSFLGAKFIFEVAES